MPAAQMSTPKPLARAPWGELGGSGGGAVGTEDVGLIGDAELLQLGAGPWTTGQSESEPIMTATFFIKNSPFRIPAGDRRKERPGPLSPRGKRFRPPAWNGQPGIAYLLFLGAQIPPQDAVLPTNGRQAHKHRRTSLPNNEWTFILSKIPIFARGQGIFVSFHKEREKNDKEVVRTAGAGSQQARRDQDALDLVGPP